MPTWKTIANVSEIAENKCKDVSVGDVAVVLIKKGGKIFAHRNICTHMDYPLHEGEIDGETIMCPLHGAKFDIETGAVRSMPAARGLHTFAVDIQGDEIRLDLEEIEND